MNKSWINFAVKNDYCGTNEWIGVNYLKVCKDAAKMGDNLGVTVLKGIIKFIDRKDFFLL